MATKPFYIHQKPPAQSFIRLPNFLFEAPSFCSLSSEAKLLYAMILRRTDLSRKNGWADDYGKIYLYYPINEVCELLHCGRQKAVDTLRELQYVDLISIKKQGCGKPFWFSAPFLPLLPYRAGGKATDQRFHLSLGSHAMCFFHKRLLFRLRKRFKPLHRGLVLRKRHPQPKRQFDFGHIPCSFLREYYQCVQKKAGNTLRGADKIPFCREGGRLAAATVRRGNFLLSHIFPRFAEAIPNDI